MAAGMCGAIPYENIHTMCNTCHMYRLCVIHRRCVMSFYDLRFSCLVAWLQKKQLICSYLQHTLLRLYENAPICRWYRHNDKISWHMVHSRSTMMPLLGRWWSWSISIQCSTLLVDLYVWLEMTSPPKKAVSTLKTTYLLAVLYTAQLIR